MATEKARRLAAEGFKTLLTCYNVPLSEHLKDLCINERGLDVVGFHKLCKTLVDKAQAIYGRDFLAEARESYPGKDLWNYYYPIALAYALELLPDRYDAIIVDEGQDFGEEFWLPLEMLLKDPSSSPLYVFYDENQNVYTRTKSFPSGLAPVTLTVNCRNTKKIHKAAYHYYKGETVHPPEVSGDEIHILDAPNIQKQAKRIYELVTRLLVAEKITASSLTILIADRLHRRQYEKALQGFALPNNCFWGSVDNRSSERITIETVARFKGLEADILVLWGLDNLPEQERREVLYVGISRAKSMLYLCGSQPVLLSVLSGR